MRVALVVALLYSFVQQSCCFQSINPIFSTSKRGLSCNHLARMVTCDGTHKFSRQSTRLGLIPESSPSPYHEKNFELLLQTSNNLDVKPLIGDDSAKFDLTEQSIKSWVTFTAAVATVLAFLYGIWLWDGGPMLGDAFKNAMESLAGGDSTLTIVYTLLLFAIAHSGMASLRPAAEEIIGARAWRVIFALISLPLAFSSIVYFINHRYDGIQLWDLRLAPGMHDFVFITSLISFFFLYPSTFNLLEVAAVDKPKLHLWETGIIRITRHPQMVGQLLWCLAHTAYIGTTFTCATSAMLCLHHLFAVWNGDRRLRDKFGENAEKIFETTSVIPFQAIITGKQKLPDDFYKEFLRLPYVTILLGTLIAYYAHPFMQAGSALLKW